MKGTLSVVSRLLLGAVQDVVIVGCSLFLFLW
jgi:hypothetical protein